MRRLTQHRGFSLIELLLALAVGAVVLLGLSRFYGTIDWASRMDSAQAALQMQAQIVVDELTRQVQGAQTIDGLATCPNGVTNTLYLAQPDGSVFCFYAANGQLWEFRQPAGSSGSAWNMLSGATSSLTVTNFDLCGVPPYNTCQTTGTIAYVSFELQATSLLGGAGVAPTMTFTVAVAKQN